MTLSIKVSIYDCHFTCTTEVNGMNTGRVGSSVGYIKLHGRGGADMAWRTRAFQLRAVAIGKARSPTVDSRYDRQAIRRRWSNPEVRGLEVFIYQVHRCRSIATFWKPERRACTESVVELSVNVADEGVEWCGWTSTTKTSAGQAVDLITDWSRLSWYDGIPAKVPLP